MRIIAGRTAAIAAALMLVACSEPADPAAADIIVGEWEKLERSMPPVNLLVTRHSDGDHARLRLSGVEQLGTVTLDGNRIVLHFPGAADVSGEILSNTQLQLDLPLPVRTNLRKLTP